MSEKAALFLGSLAMMALAIVMYKAADPMAGLFGRAADRWQNDEVIRGPAFKVWKDRSPRNFTFMVGIYNGAAVFWWFALRGIGILLGLIAVGSLVVATFSTP